MILENGAGQELWDFAEREVLAVYGHVGGGKTTLAQHVALSWAETGVCNVIVGSTEPSEWDTLRDIVHVTSPEEAFEFGLLMRHYPKQNCVVVIDGADDLNLEGPESYELRNMAWTFTSYRPLFHGWEGRWTNLGVGTQSLEELTDAFGEEDSGYQSWRKPVPHLRGRTVRSDDNGHVVEERLAFDLAENIPSRALSAYRKKPLRGIPSRDWYAPAPWMAA